MEFVLILLSCLLLTTRAASSSDAVLHMAGQELRRGQGYYVLPVISSNGGGVTIGDKNEPCPLRVMLEEAAARNGRPVAFFPQDPQDDDVVRVGSLLYAMFPVPTHCPQSTVWEVALKTGFVSTGGRVTDTDRPNYSRFVIRKSEKLPGYVLECCACKGCGCLPLGVDTRGGRRHLGLNKFDPLVVMFVKAEEVAVIQPAVMRPNSA